LEINLPTKLEKNVKTIKTKTSPNSSVENVAGVDKKERKTSKPNPNSNSPMKINSSSSDNEEKKEKTKKKKKTRKIKANIMNT